MLLPVIAISISGSSLQAATIVQSQSFSVAQDDLNFVFNKFDTSLGTLTGVSITLNYTRSGGYVVADNEGASQATISFTHNTNVGVDADQEILDWTNLAGGARLLSSTSNRSTASLPNIVIGADSEGGSADFTGSDSYRFDLAAVEKTSSGSFANISQFQGAGTYSVPVSVTQGTTVTGSGAFAQATQPALVEGSFTITYTYDAAAPVPEPSGAMLSMISAGILLSRRRRSGSVQA
ncbi:MAG: hypothetical protein RLZ97_676 [Verrucomicrobiota bacterium]|jgi:hypothetical protein